MTEMLHTWRAFLDAFNKACDTDEWGPLAPFLTEDVTYRVTGVPFACQIKGREAVVAGFAKSIRGFDQKFDSRVHEPVAIKVYDPDTVTCGAWGRYEKAGLPDVRICAQGYWHFSGGKISAMTDLWDVTLIENQHALAWLAEHGSDMDASYV
ncbi:nuclear transport factor 2 family protein [Pyruvatibacter sp.]|uniref:nuclear transport factor 2 family protein n=1 Tax=Pyruvatibacter sp. TaxID=1981328 RepID=UPI0032670DF9